MAHTQGKKHQSNLARRAAKDSKATPLQVKVLLSFSTRTKHSTILSLNFQPAPEKPRIEPKKFVKIGRPGYRVTKQRDPENSQQSLLFQIDYPGERFFCSLFHCYLPSNHVIQLIFTEIREDVRPRHRFMSAYEQRVEPPDRKWQYLLFAAEPYETIAFKVIISFGLVESM